MTVTEAPAAEAPAVDPSAPTMTSGIAGLVGFARPAAPAFALAGALAVVASLVALVPFWAIYRALAEVVEGGADRSELNRLALLAVVAIAVRFVLFGLSMAISHVAAYRTLYGIRISLAEHLAHVPLGYVTRRRSGELKKVMGDDVERLELFLAHGLPDVLAAAVTLIAVPIWLFAVDWRMGLATVVLAVPAICCMGLAMSRSSAHMGDYHATLTAMNASVVELVRGMPVVKVFNRGTDRVRDAEQAVEDHVRVVRRYSGAFLPLGTAFFVLLTANVALLVPVGVWLHDSGSISDTDLLFFFVLGLGALAPVLSLLNLFSYLAHLTSGGNLVTEVLEAATLDEADGATVPADASVELRDVVFAYDETTVLDGVSLRAEPGTLTALVGPSGSGKTTIAALIARFWDVRSGEVLVGGVDVRDLSPDVLAGQVTVVLQDPFLFDDSVRENIRVGRADATDGEVEAAAGAAQAHGFVTALPDGYDTMVGERGARLSGGERQRLTLARAILADAPVILLDEATSFADPENEALIQQAIEELIEGKTVIMIAHRLSTVAGADQILVVDGGRITERGRHAELLDRGGTYARLWADFQAAESISLGDAVRRGSAR